MFILLILRFFCVFQQTLHSYSERYDPSSQNIRISSSILQAKFCNEASTYNSHDNNSQCIIRELTSLKIPVESVVCCTTASIIDPVMNKCFVPYYLAL